MNAWVFDIDGVLTNLETRQVSEELLSILSKINAFGEPIAFVTGRSFSWTQRRVLATLEKHRFDFDKLLCSCEKGGIKVTYERQKSQIKINEKLVIPKQIQQDVKNLVEREFKKTMFYDPKLTMATVEAREDVSNVKFQKDQKVLNEKMHKIMEQYSQKGILKMDIATIATDIESVNVSKEIGATDFLSWLAAKSAKPDHFYTFGDRQADIEVPTLLHQKGFNVTAIFTGGKNELKSTNVPFKLIVTDQLYDKGTLGFFRDTLY